MTQKPVTAIILGAGHRAMAYAEYSLAHPDELQIVGVADPDERRRNHVRDLFGFPEDNCFYDALALSKAPNFADVVINGTMTKFTLKPQFPYSKRDTICFSKSPSPLTKRKWTGLILYPKP